MSTRPIAYRDKVAVVTQLGLGGGALLLGGVAGLPLVGMVFLGYALGSGLAASALSSLVPLRHVKGRALGLVARWLGRMTWACWGGTWIVAIWAHDRFLILDASARAMAWLVAGSFVAGHVVTRNAIDWRWMKGMAWAWAFGGGVLWLAAAYQRNHATLFYGGLLLMLALGIVLRMWVRPSGVGIHAAHTLILLALGLPITDWLAATVRLAAASQIGDRPYAYETARQEPWRFSAWWQTYQAAWERMAQDIFIPDPDEALPLRLKPGSRGYLMESLITINRHGFRGSDWEMDAPDTYRIVALGESTTFGCTLRAGDRPWPELLEEWIREELRPHRPVRVINAGVPAYDLGDNVRRFEHDLAPLRPDLVVSYHGYNGFPLLRGAVPPVEGDIGPLYRRRPLRLLAQVEYRLRRQFHAQSSEPAPSEDLSVARPLLETDYAAHYEELLRKAQTTGARLVLCTFSMAVNVESPSDLVEFYRPAFPAVRWQARANEAHSRLLRELQRHHAGLLVIDTQPGLDGRHEQFIDLVHLTQEGRRRLAQSIFHGLKPVLREELTPAGSVPAEKPQE
jgi:lysophospholipase L1-like esterase